jgi:hypothetical protein
MRLRRSSPKLTLQIIQIVSLLSAFSAPRSLATTVTWKASPATGDWYTASNWVENVAPGDSYITATFDVSSVTEVNLPGYAPIDGIKFTAAASAFTIAVGPSPGFLNMQGSGVVNASSVAQTLVAAGGSTVGSNGGRFGFYNNAAPGTNTVYTSKAGAVSGASGGIIEFNNTTGAGGNTFTNEGGNNSLTDAGNGGSVSFRDTATAGSASFTNQGGTGNGSLGGIVYFSDASSAENGVFINHGSAVSGGYGGFIDFFGTATAGNGTFTNDGGTANGASGGNMLFAFTSTAGNATLIANGGTNAGNGSYINFTGDSTGGTAAIKVYGNGNLTLVSHNAPGITIGSLEGTGFVYLAGLNLTVGSNNLSTTFSGVINLSIGPPPPGSLTKIGSGTLELTGANFFQSGTTISAGTLLANNTNGSALGSGPVTVATGATLGGNGFIAGATTVAAGGHLAPGNPAGPLTFKAGLNLVSGAELDFQVDGTVGRIEITGGILTTASGTGAVKINLTSPNGFVPRTAYTLVHFLSGQTSGVGNTTFAIGKVSGGVPSDYTLGVTATEVTVTYNGIPTPISPVITSASSVGFVSGLPGSFTVTATGLPTPTLTVAGLPTWAAFDPTTGVLTATAPATFVAPFNITLTASNGIPPNATQTIAVTITGVPTFTTQPADRAIAAGGNATLSVATQSNPQASYRWESRPVEGVNWSIVSNGGVYSGADTAILTITGATIALSGYSFRCVVTNDLGSVNSASAQLKVSPLNFTGTYFGTFPNDHGRWALRVNPDNTAVYIAYLTTRHTAVVEHVTIQSNGSFAVTGREIAGLAAIRNFVAMSVIPSVRRNLASSFSLSGQITNGDITGQLSGLDETFSGTADVVSGSSPSGFYTAGALNAATGTTYAIISPSGQALLVISSAAGIDSATGSISSGGQLTAVTAGGAQIVLSVNTSRHSVAVVLTPAGTATAINFSGLAADTPSTTRLVNLSVRSRAGKEDKTLIMGFVVAGSGIKQALIRGLGPLLSNYGVQGALADPQLRLYSAVGGLIDSNNDWGTTANLSATFSALGAIPLGGGSKDAALLRGLGAGVYSAHVTTADASTGVALAEIYDADKTGARLVNISARSDAGTGENILVAGFVLEGNAPQTLLIRGLGPTLGALGVAGSLVDPRLKLYDHASALIAENGDWSGTTALKNVFATVGAAPMASDTSKDSALLVTLEPGVYSAQVSGEAGTTGVALVEIYEVR